MSRFSARKVSYTGRLRLPGPCACPGEPHDFDWVVLRSFLSGGEASRLAQLPFEGQLLFLLKDWNLTDHTAECPAGDDDTADCACEGVPMEITAQNISRIWGDTWQALDKLVTEHVRQQPLPNGSGAPSANGTQASASPTRGTRTRTSKRSTTS